MNTSTKHAIAAFFWSEHFDGDSVDPKLEQQIAADWQDFQEKAEAMGFDAVEHRATVINSAEGDEWDYAAHDFILTRNHHGAGFWDGDWHEPWGDKLTKLAHTYSELEAYIDDDGMLCLDSYTV